MLKNVIKKLAVAATVVCAAGGMAAAAGCNIETKHPEVTVAVSFLDQTYELEYTLYRNMYPNTVRRFTELADKDFYDGMIVHNYTSNDWFSGGYYCDAEAYAAAVSGGEGAMTEYLEGHSAESAFMEKFNGDELTPSVYKFNPDAVSADDALPTLIGEFKNNINQEIKNGALTAGFGVLKMYYYEKTSTEKVSVTPADGRPIMADYKNNCATSLFAMQLGTGSGLREDSYCVFGKINNSAKLTELADAVSDYLKTLGTDTVSANGVQVENEVEIFSSADSHLEQDFVLPYEPIIIKSVSVTKW